MHMFKFMNAFASNSQSGFKVFKQQFRIIVYFLKPLNIVDVYQALSGAKRPSWCLEMYLLNT